MNVFNNHTLIPTFLPPDGGNWPWQLPLGPAPPGFVNKTASGGGTLTGHTVYLIVQGIIHNTRMALSPAGTQADIDLVKNLYGEPWWLQALAARDLTVIGEKQWYCESAASGPLRGRPLRGDRRTGRPHPPTHQFPLLRARLYTTQRIIISSQAWRRPWPCTRSRASSFTSTRC